MKKNKIIIFSLLLALASITQATVVRFETNVGVIDIELYEDQAPLTAQNFLNYVNRGDYDGTVFHRSVPGFVIQGGGYRYGNGAFTTVATDSPITNEAGEPNLPGTIAMARTSDPHSATNQWFFNLENNTGLNPGSGNAGYAVFGEVIKGLDVVFNIGSYRDYRYNNSITNLPLINYSNGAINSDNVVKIERAYRLSDTFQINPGLSGAWFNPATDGQGVYIEVLPATGQVIMAWFTFDTEFPEDLTPSEVGYAGNRWLVAVGDFVENEFVGTVYQTSGGKFDDPTAVSNTAVGTVSLSFNSCLELVMSYSLYEGSLNGMNNLQRISDANVELCQRLASEANQGIAQ